MRTHINKISKRHSTRASCLDSAVGPTWRIWSGTVSVDCPSAHAKRCSHLESALTCNSSQAETERIPAADLQTNRACWKILMRRERSRKADVVLQLSDNNARHD